MPAKRGMCHIMATAAMAFGLSSLTMLYAKNSNAEEVRLPVTERIQLRLSDDPLPSTMDNEGRIKLYRLGLDLELKLQDWLVPYIRGESGAFDFGGGAFGDDSSRSTYPLGNPKAGLEIGGGIKIPLYENPKDKTRLELDIGCGKNSVSGESCFAGVGYRF